MPQLCTLRTTSPAAGRGLGISIIAIRFCCLNAAAFMESHLDFAILLFEAAVAAGGPAAADRAIKLVGDASEDFLGGRDARRLHLFDQLPSGDSQHLLSLMLVKPLDAHQFQNRQFTHARAEVSLRKLGIE